MLSVSILVSMISLCAATSSSVLGLYFSTQGASLPSTVLSTGSLAAEVLASMAEGRLQVHL